jgi:hypothetical protein
LGINPAQVLNYGVSAVAMRPAYNTEPIPWMYILKRVGAFGDDLAKIFPHQTLLALKTGFEWETSLKPVFTYRPLNVRSQ